MNTLKIFPGGTPEEVYAAYKAWWEQQTDIELVARPTCERDGKGWKLSVWFRPSLVRK